MHLKLGDFKIVKLILHIFFTCLNKTKININLTISTYDGEVGLYDGDVGLYEGDVGL